MEKDIDMLLALKYHSIIEQKTCLFSLWEENEGFKYHIASSDLTNVGLMLPTGFLTFGKGCKCTGMRYNPCKNQTYTLNCCVCGVLSYTFP